MYHPKLMIKYNDWSNFSKFIKEKAKDVPIDVIKQCIAGYLDGKRLLDVFRENMEGRDFPTFVSIHAGLDGIAYDEEEMQKEKKDIEIIELSVSEDEDEPIDNQEALWIDLKNKDDEQVETLSNLVCALSNRFGLKDIKVRRKNAPK